MNESILKSTEKAGPPHNRALEIHEEEIGKEHPNVETCLNNLALLYYDQGRYAEGRASKPFSAILEDFASD